MHDCLVSMLVGSRWREGKKMVIVAASDRRGRIGTSAVRVVDVENY